MSKPCAYPSCNNPGKLICAGCAEVQYCSKDCQKAHWPAHKTLCKTAPRSLDRLKESELRSVLLAKADSYENKLKRNTLLNKAENPEEKTDALRRLAKEHITDGEIDALLQLAQEKNKRKEARMASLAQKQAKASGKNVIKPPSNFSPGTPSPEQLRQQAMFMRKNPEAVRKAQPAFATLSDEQIRAYADQLDQAASDPKMMQEVERMASLGEDDKKLVQNIQSGLSGALPITDEWITEIVRALKQKPELFKTMFGGKGAFSGGGITDEQVNSYIDMFSGMSEWMLKAIAYGIWYLASAVKPLSNLYQLVDKYTLGSARYLVFGLFAFVMYYVSMFVFFIAKLVVAQLYSLYLLATGGKAAVAASAAASTAASAAANTASTAAAKVAGAGLAAAGVNAALNAVKDAAANTAGPEAAAQQMEEEF